MGKVRPQRRRFRGASSDPMGLGGRGRDDGEEEMMMETGRRRGPATPGDTVQAVLDQLQRATVEDKECALSTLAQHVECPEFQEEILKHDLIRIVAPLLLDTSCLVRHVAAGALRNLSTCGEEMCDFMVEQDVMTSIVVLLKREYTNWAPKSKAEDGHVKSDMQTDTFIQVVNLLWNLCESNDVAVKVFNREGLLPILFNYLDTQAADPEIRLSVAHCLHTVTEDNPGLVEQGSELESHLQKQLQVEGDSPDMLLYKILITGIILNFSLGKAATLDPILLHQVVATIAGTLEEDHRRRAGDFAGCIVSSGRSGDAFLKNGKGEDMDLDGTTTKKFLQAEKELDHFLTSQQIAVETLTNLCCTEEGDSVSEEEEDYSDDNFNEGELDHDCTLDDKLRLCIPSEVHEAVVKHDLINKVLCKANLPAENNMKVLQEDEAGRKVLVKLATLRCRSFLCLHNLVVNLDVEELGGAPLLYDVWQNLSSLVFKQGGASLPEEEDSELLEAATSAMRALVQKLAEMQWSDFGGTTLQDVKGMCNAAINCTDSNVRANLVRVVGTLGTMFTTSTSDNGPDLVKLVGNFLLDVCSKDPDLWVVAEAFDATFDVFAEDETDIWAKEIHLVDRLNSLLPNLTHKIKQQRKHLGEHLPIVLTAKSNLTRFIKYKRAGKKN